MKDEVQELAAAVVNQARLPGQATGGYSATSGTAGGIPTPGYVQDEDGYPVRFFIPGRDPLYVEGMTERYILGDGTSE